MNLSRARCQLSGSFWQGASERAGGLGLSGAATVSQRAAFRTGGCQVGKKVGDSPRCPLLPGDGVRVVGERLLTALDPLSGADSALPLGIGARGGLLIDRSGGHLSISTNYD